MTKLLLKILVFCIPIILFLCGIIPIDSLLFNQRLNQEKQILVAGDSRLESSVNPSMNEEIINVSTSGETYFYTYYKLKKIFQIYQPEYVVVSLAPSNLTYFQDQKTFALEGNERYKSIVPAFALAIGTEGLRVLKERMPDDIKFTPLLVKALSVSIKESFQGRNSYLGEYLEIIGSHLNADYIHQRASLHFIDAAGSVHAESDFSEEYLRRIASLCKDNKVELVLISTPVHPIYQEMIPLAFQSLAEEVRKSFEKEKLATIIDYSNLNLEDKYFADGDHLNLLGSQLITENLLRDLKK